MKRTSMILSFLMLAMLAIGQTITVKGNVKDDAGEDVIGATVKVEGSQNGTVTDIDGNFTLNQVKVGERITITYVGYEPQTVKITGTAPINVTLKSDHALLEWNGSHQRDTQVRPCPARRGGGRGLWCTEEEQHIRRRIDSEDRRVAKGRLGILG